MNKEQVTEVLLYQVRGNGESIWEKFEGKFGEKQVQEYLEFLVKNKYISQAHADRWKEVYKEVYDCDDSMGEYAQIEAMTFISVDEIPYDVFEHYGLEDNEDGSVVLAAAEEKGLLNVPIVVKFEDEPFYNEIYWDKAIPIMAHYVSENYEYYKDVLSRIVSNQ